MWKSAVLVLVATSVVGACQYKKNECPDYTVVEQHPDYEVRSYSGLTWASTSELGSLRRVAQYVAFMRLFRYISGNNDKAQKMAMTVPVRMRNVETDNGTLFTMDFMVPSQFADNAPTPNDTSVVISKEEPSLYAVRSFKGYVWRSNRWVEEAEKLADSVKEDVSVDTSNYYQVGYDAPFDLFDRRNEIWMRKKSNPESNDV